MIEKVGKNFKIVRKIDEGAFGQIYQAINTRTNLEVAVKIEPVNTDHPQLIYECKLYNYLHNDSTVIDKGIPNIYYCSTEGNTTIMQEITMFSSWIWWGHHLNHSSIRLSASFLWKLFWCWSTKWSPGLNMCTIGTLSIEILSQITSAPVSTKPPTKSLSLTLGSPRDTSRETANTSLTERVKIWLEPHVMPPLIPILESSKVA